MRQKRSLVIPVTVTVILMSITIALMVLWIIFAANSASWTGLTLGTLAFAIVLCGLSYYLIITVKERQFLRRQMNFVDSVTHELKSPIASLRLYLETMQVRDISEEKRTEFIQTMDGELKRLDSLISQLLEVARLDAIGDDSPSEAVELQHFFERCAAKVCVRHKREMDDVFEFELPTAGIKAPRIMLEMIFRNLFDNAVKYGGSPPKVQVKSSENDKHISIDVIDNGEGIPVNLRKRVFSLFFRAGNELTRTQKGTGLGLYIAGTLVKKLGGNLNVHDRADASGSIFRVELPRAVTA
ncbi:MAG: HAMP domain-containing sensor histidine kinase [Planctomycetota bacterium]